MGKKFEEFKSEFIQLLDERLKGLAIEKSNASSIGSNVQESKKVKDGSITREEINACKSLQQLTGIVGHEFTFDLENNMVYCDYVQVTSVKEKRLVTVG